MTPQESAKLSRDQLAARIEELSMRYRPAIIGYREENGRQIAIVQAAYAEGARGTQRVKPTGRSGYEL